MTNFDETMQADGNVQGRQHEQRNGRPEELPVDFLLLIAYQQDPEAGEKEGDVETYGMEVNVNYFRSVELMQYPMPHRMSGSPATPL